MTDIILLFRNLIDETKRNTEATERAEREMRDLRIELKTRNKIDNETLVFCKRLIIIQLLVICLFAGLKIMEMSRFIP